MRSSLTKISPLAFIEKGVEVLTEGIKQISQTKQKKIEEENYTKQISIKAEENKSIAETNATRDSRNHANDNFLKVSDSAIKNNKDVALHSMNNSTDVSKISIQNNKELIQSTMEYSKDINDIQRKDTLILNETHQEQLNEKSLSIEEYQQALQALYIKSSELKIKEEIKNEISNNVLSFAEEVAYYNENIANLELELNQQTKQLKPHKFKMQETEIELRILDSEYKKNNIEFHKQIDSLKELAYEHKKNMQEEGYNEAYDRKERKLIDMQTDISNIELKLLTTEKERLHKEKMLEKEINTLDKLKISLGFLKNKQSTLISIGIHKITHIEVKKSPTYDNTIDTEVIKASNLDNILMSQ